MNKTCPKCSVALPDNASFCSACATPLNSTICSSCNNTNEVTAKYCQFCASALHQTPNQPQHFTQEYYHSSPSFIDNSEEVDAAKDKIKYFKIGSIVTGCLVLAMLIGGFSHISQLNTQIQFLKGEVAYKKEESKKLQDKIDKTDEKLTEKDGELEETKEQSKANEQKAKNKQIQLSKEKKTSKNLRNDLNAISACVKGIDKTVRASQSNTYVDYDTQEKIKASCEKARKVVKKMRSSNK